MRLFAVSDLHIDYPQNLEWVEQISNQDYKQDGLIVAGDITDRVDLLERCFNKLNQCFKVIFYVPGNHELWVNRSEYHCSVEKFYALMSQVQQLGALTSPWREGDLTVVPLLGWYDYSFGEPGEWLKKSWMDYYACQWMEIDGTPRNITDYFIRQNVTELQERTKITISFSHFLPRIDVMPDRIPPEHRRLYPVLGSEKIDAQLRKLGASTHVYGHSHVNRDVMIEGVRYVNNAFGSPRESRITRKSLYQVY